MNHVISFEFLNFFNFGDDGEKQLVGLRQASGRRQKVCVKSVTLRQILHFPR